MPAVKNDEIRRRRQRLGIKLGEFAKRTGVKYQYVANIESGCSKPGIEVVYILARELGCEAEDLLDEAEAA